MGEEVKFPPKVLHDAHVQEYRTKEPTPEFIEPKEVIAQYDGTVGDGEKEKQRTDGLVGSQMSSKAVNATIERGKVQTALMDAGVTGTGESGSAEDVRKKIHTLFEKGEKSEPVQTAMLPVFSPGFFV